MSDRRTTHTHPLGTGPHPLDNPALGSLTGPHAHFAERRGRVLRYPVDVSPWLALPDDPDADDWADLAALVGPGGEAPLAGFNGRTPEGWELTFDLAGVQLVDASLAAAPDAGRCGSAPPTYRRCWTWWNAPGRAPSCRAPWSSAPTSGSAVAVP